jgi:fructose-bisphosphate aldolase class II
MLFESGSQIAHSLLLSMILQPREALRAAEVNTVKRLEQTFADLKCQNICGLGQMEAAENVLGPRRGGLPV